MSTSRLDVKKTYRLYIAGNSVRSESTHHLAARSPAETQLNNVRHASHKDFRGAVVAARTALDGRAKKSAYLRGQIIYCTVEMLQNRSSELAPHIATAHGRKRDRGWCARRWFERKVAKRRGSQPQALRKTRACAGRLVKSENRGLVLDSSNGGIQDGAASDWLLEK